MQSGTLLSQNYEYKVRTGTFFESKKDVENLLLGIFGGRPVYLKDVADVVDGPSEVKDYVLIGFGPAAKDQDVKPGELYPAVTIAVAKRKGTNAIDVANEVIKDELLKKLFIATASVILLIAVTLGIREAIVVGIAVPVTLSIALFISEALGFTLNRVTLFALIFAIGILVDDAIVVVENIHRWFELKLAKYPREAIVRATDEVGNPTILATFTVIAGSLHETHTHKRLREAVLKIPCRDRPPSG
jgi:multidrug efflux pump subunit AcrB